MKTKAELMQEIERLKIEVEKLKDDEGMKVGDEYWSLTPSLAVVACRWDNLTLDHDILAANNVFRTKAEAEKESRHRLFEAAVTMRFKELGGGEFKADGSNWGIRINTYSKIPLLVQNNYLLESPRGWYAQDAGVAEQVRHEFDFVGWAMGEL